MSITLVNNQRVSPLFLFYFLVRFASVFYIKCVQKKTKLLYLIKLAGYPVRMDKKLW